MQRDAGAVRHARNSAGLADGRSRCRAADPPLPTFRSGIDVIALDVLVSNRSQRQSHRQSDRLGVRSCEDGVRRAIASFTTVRPLKNAAAGTYALSVSAGPSAERKSSSRKFRLSCGSRSRRRNRMRIGSRIPLLLVREACRCALARRDRDLLRLRSELLVPRLDRVGARRQSLDLEGAVLTADRKERVRHDAAP